MYPLGDSPNWYQIRFNENENGWVPKTGNVIEVKPETPEQPAETITHQNVLWLRVEEAPATAAVTAPSQPYVLSLEVGVRVRSEPNADLSNVQKFLAHLRSPNAIPLWVPSGTWMPQWTLNTVGGRLICGETLASKLRNIGEGWVRNDVVTGHGDLTGVPVTWSAGAGSDRAAAESGTWWNRAPW